MSPTVSVLVCICVSLTWAAAYRLPWADPGRANRAAMSLSTFSGLTPGIAWAVFGTTFYVVLGLGGLALIMVLGGVGMADLVGFDQPGRTLATTLLAWLGAMSASALAMSILYRVRPTVDVPAAIRKVRWIETLESIPKRFRFLVPLCGAFVEEAFYRGVVYVAILTAGAPAWVAFFAATVLFTGTQVWYVEGNPIAKLVIGSSSLIISVFGTLLFATFGSVLPALAVHMSFAGFFSNVSWDH